VKIKVAVVIVAGMLAPALPMVGLAHHSFAVFFDDAHSLITVRGKVTGFEFKNPHGLIVLAVKDPSGQEVVWKAETNSPSILERRGWTKTSLKLGEEISVDGWPARDGKPYMRMRKVTRADGTPVGVPFDQPQIK
jgi:Family of unknown function (DUF6152)